VLAGFAINKEIDVAKGILLSLFLDPEIAREFFHEIESETCKR
jgi:hypothetical protein